MAHPSAKLLSIADFAAAVLQAPAFLRAQGAAVEMEDLIVSLRGRPVPRKGYEVIDTSNLSIGTADGSYTEGDQIIAVHWLGDDDTPDGIKRIYRLPRNATYVQDEIGRLLYIVSRGFPPIFVDVKDNALYHWDLTPPDADTDGSNFDMAISGQLALNVNRDLAAIESGDIEKGGITTVFPTPSTTGTYIDIRAQTDITNVLVAISTQDGDFVRVLYEGSLDQGGHRFFWDGRNEAGNSVATGLYIAVFYISEVGGKTIVNTSPSNDEPQDGWWSQFFRGVLDGVTLGLSVVLDAIFSSESTGLSNAFEVNSVPSQPSKFYLSGQFRYVCFTYFNEDLNIETRPSLVAKERVYFWHVRDEDPPEFDITLMLDTDDAPNWATHLNVYVSEDPTGLEEYTKAIETGIDFFRIGSVQLETTLLDNYTGVLDTALILDSYEHDEPVDGFHTMGAYGVGLWGAANNRLYFNKIGNLGEQRIYALPSENALVPHSFPLPRSGQSPILHVHPAAHDSALIVFKRDALHIIKGSGVISGLYDPQTIVEVDVDASHVIDGVGTMSPRSVLTVGGAVYFVGSDNRFYQYGTNWRGQVDVRDVGLPIQQYLDDLTVAELENLVAFLYQNCYHLITPERVIILDMTRKYWASASWRLKDAFWSRGGVNAESILYGVRQDDTLVELFKGDTDNGEPIGGIWQSNPIAVPSEASITGVLCVHTTTPAPTVRVRVDIDDVEGVAEEFEPDKYNDYRHGIHGSGSRVSVRLETDDGFPLCDRIQLEVFVVP